MAGSVRSTSGFLSLLILGIYMHSLVFDYNGSFIFINFKMHLRKL